ncbi:S41 family peptidase [Pedobacter xixiisoli]|uniref:Peptidase family S41 n=1 Tax=Pedobacter xixiisoli TaxID=1476464 RepID=A0A286A0E8_9SPHI|nr:S41 family peptidase [Pedobacter xixiisoli]SOD15370.1 Peptidase family S41 [Pedobacter xixiisoli]
MKKILYLIAVLFAQSLSAQQLPACNCEQTLTKLISKVETEYPGFSAKTKEAFLYNGFKENLIAEAKKADELTCRQLLKRYTDYFKDPHLWVGANGAPFAAGGVIGSVASFAVDIKDFQDKVQSSEDHLEGVWITDGYKIGIKKNGKDEYVGFIIEAESISWKPKEIKFKLLTNGDFEYALLDKSLKQGSYKYYDEGVLFLDEVSVTLVKQVPKSKVNEAKVAARLKEFEGFYIKKLTARTTILKLPSFEYQYLKEINELIEQHKELLENTENLIVDLRGNPGGTTDAYKKLLPYIMGKNIRNTGAEFLATQTYIDNLERYKKTLDANASTEGIDKNIATLKQQLGKFVNFNGGGELVQIQEVEIAAKSPKNVVVLANKRTGSSAEYFLFLAKQSKKVKLMGIPSYGALDYGNAYLIDFGCANYQLLMPTYRALRLPEYPIDNIGIQPDVHLDKSVKDWVEFAVKYLEE